LNTISPVAGVVIVATSTADNKAIRGGKNPLFVASTSKAAEVWGVCVPNPNCANKGKVKTTNTSDNTNFFIGLLLKKT
jgi:hypothetical protein